MHIATTTLQRGPAQFDQVGQLLGYPLKNVKDDIRPGLAQRLVKHAQERFVEAGFGPAISGAQVEVYTMDGDDKPSDRSYNVKFLNEKGGYLELCRILTINGWPSLDHGFAIGHEN